MSPTVINLHMEKMEINLDAVPWRCTNTGSDIWMSHGSKHRKWKNLPPTSIQWTETSGSLTNTWVYPCCKYHIKDHQRTGSSGCDVTHRKQLASGSNPVAVTDPVAIQLPFFCDLNATMLEAEIVNKQWLVRVYNISMATALSTKEWAC